MTPEVGSETTDGTTGNSYDTNALAETKTEVIHHRGPWRSLDAVEYTTLEWSTGSTIAGSWN